MGDVIVPGARVRGEVRAHYVNEPRIGTPQHLCYLYRNRKQDLRVLLPGDWIAQGQEVCNLIMYEWASITGELLTGSLDRRTYHLAAMLIEFENNGGAVVTPPDNDDRANGRDYYDSLLTDPNRDYLRVPMTAAVLESTDDELFPNGNKITCFAQTTGTVGVHGKPFNDVVQSRVYGGALVSTPRFADATQDMIFSRFYFATAANQLIKLVGAQVGLKWPITLG